jgi:hypothetical protein
VKQEMITQGGQRFHRKAEKDGFFWGLAESVGVAENVSGLVHGATHARKQYTLRTFGRLHASRVHGRSAILSKVKRGTLSRPQLWKFGNSRPRLHYKLSRQRGFRKWLRISCKFTEIRCISV